MSLFGGSTFAMIDNFTAVKGKLSVPKRRGMVKSHLQGNVEMPHSVLVVAPSCGELPGTYYTSICIMLTPCARNRDWGPVLSSVAK